jgi:hypothetical protein
MVSAHRVVLFRLDTVRPRSSGNDTLLLYTKYMANSGSVQYSHLYAIGMGLRLGHDHMQTIESYQTGWADICVLGGRAPHFSQSGTTARGATRIEPRSRLLILVLQLQLMALGTNLHNSPVFKAKPPIQPSRDKVTLRLQGTEL